MLSRAAVLAVTTALAMEAAAQSPDCSAKDSFEAARCFGQSYDTLDKQLNVVYQRLLKTLSKPAQNNVDYPKIRAALIESQRLWVQFRDKDCAAYIMLNGGGTAGPAMHADCLSKRTEQRIKELQEWGG